MIVEHADFSDLPFHGMMLSPSTENFRMLSLPPEIVQNIIQRLDYQALKALRCCCKQFSICTTPLLFATVRIRFRLRDLTALRCIAGSNSLRGYVHTLLYVGDQYCNVRTFRYWKRAVGIINTLPHSKDDTADPGEPTSGTLEHEQWRGYRQYQQILIEQSEMHKQRLDHEILLEAIPRFSNLKHLYLLQQEDYYPPQENCHWRNHSQSPSVERLMRGFKRSSDIYQADELLPEAHRNIWFHQSLEWLLSAPDTLRGLESLVISGLKSANHESLTVPGLTNVARLVFTSLRQLTLDFRIVNDSSFGPGHDRWFCSAIKFMVTSSPHLETVDILAPSTERRLRLAHLEIFDGSIKYARLQELQLAFVTFDEEELRLFVGYLKSSLRRLTFKHTLFTHETPWMDYVLFDPHVKSLVEAQKHVPSNDEQVTWFMENWANPPDPVESQRHAIEEEIRSDETGQVWATIRRTWDREKHDERYHLGWPEGHVFAGACGTWDRPENGWDTLTVEWPRTRPAS